MKIGGHPCEEQRLAEARETRRDSGALDEANRGGSATVSAVVVSRNDAFAPGMLNTRGVSSFNDLKIQIIHVC